MLLPAIHLRQCLLPSISKLVPLLVLAAALSGCTEVQYLSHLYKQMDEPAPVSSPSAQEGTFKVGKPYKVDGQWYQPREQYEFVETGVASWYGPGFHGRRTANGEVFRRDELTAAHRTLQMPSLVRVTNLDNGRSVVVRINDRGPFKRGRVIDVSEKAAELLGFKGQGTAKVRLEVLREESLRLADVARSGVVTRGYEEGYQVASASSLYDGGLVPGSVSRETLITPAEEGPRGLAHAVPGHVREGAFYPDPLVAEAAVQPASLYVQAGAFSNQNNAWALREKLSYFNNAQVYTVQVGRQSYYRVRIGPLGRVEEADEVLSRLVNAGHRDAMIVVE